MVVLTLLARGSKLPPPGVSTFAGLEEFLSNPGAAKHTTRNLLRCLPELDHMIALVVRSLAL